MKNIILVVHCIFAFSAYSQTADTITVVHKYYSTTFSKSKHIPVLVKYWLTKNMLSCGHRVNRKNKFTPDPLLKDFTNLKKDYYRSKYDRGHNMDAYDNGCDPTGMTESFYYSNICPQTHSLNAGVWKVLEEYTRQKVNEYDSIFVWCGSVVTGDEHIGDVEVPDYCWKVIFVKSQNSTEAYSFQNDNSQRKSLQSYQVSLDSIQHLSGFRFQSN